MATREIAGEILKGRRELYQTVAVAVASNSVPRMPYSPQMCSTSRADKGIKAPKLRKSRAKLRDKVGDIAEEFGSLKFRLKSECQTTRDGKSTNVYR